MTLIDKAEALRLAREVRCGNCGSWIDPENLGLECCERPDWRDGRDAQQLARAIAALPARGVGVKPSLSIRDWAAPDHDYRPSMDPDDQGDCVECGNSASWHNPPALAPTDAAEVEAHDELLGVWADELMADLVLNGLMDLVNHDYDTKVGARREIIAALGKANQARAPQIAPTDAAQAREAAARLLLDMLYMQNGAHEGVSKEDAQKMWDAASTRDGYAAVDAFLRSIIGEARP